MIGLDFSTTFVRLTDTAAPFPWQSALYDRFVSDRPDNVPACCDLPTGLGKTSVVAIWLIALASRPDRMPRRLVYVVNRRTVVDQTTSEVEKLRRNLDEREELQSFKDRLGPLAISTLRGQFADNRAWSADPSRPAVIVGTVDMIGSRLLFSGYGVGFKSRPLHAGFLGQDALLVHDEAHLEPAFQELIKTIQWEQERRERTGGLPWPKLRVMELTATSRAGDHCFPNADEWKENEIHPIVRDRLEAKKGIALHTCPRSELAKAIGKPGPARINRQGTQAGAIHDEMVHLGTWRCSQVRATEDRTASSPTLFRDVWHGGQSRKRGVDWFVLRVFDRSPTSPESEASAGRCDCDRGVRNHVWLRRADGHSSLGREPSGLAEIAPRASQWNSVAGLHSPLVDDVASRGFSEVFSELDCASHSDGCRLSGAPV
jgi:Type III restriction enzyme, res subunit